MKPGKISENVLKRSVLKHIQLNNNKTIKGAGVGNDCAFFAYENVDKNVVYEATIGTTITTNTLSLPVSCDKLMYHAVFSAVNNLFAQGYKADGIVINITLPERVREIKLQEMMKQAAYLSESMDMNILGGHTEVSSAVIRPVISVTAVSGQKLSNKLCNGKELSGFVSGYDIVLTKYIGMEASCLIADVKEEELLSRFPKIFVEEAKKFNRYLSVEKEAAIAEKSDVCLMHDVREGGVFGALWEMAEGAGVGLDVDLKKIPMKQTVIEICNYYDLNPYEIMSGGCLLIAVKDGEALVKELYERNIEAAVIGTLTDRNDRIIRNGEETRYLDLPKPDQIRKLLV